MKGSVFLRNENQAQVLHERKFKEGYNAFLFTLPGGFWVIWWPPFWGKFDA